MCAAVSAANIRLNKPGPLEIFVLGKSRGASADEVVAMASAPYEGPIPKAFPDAFFLVVAAQYTRIRPPQ